MHRFKQYILATVAGCGADGQRWKGLLDVPLGAIWLVRNNVGLFWWSREFFGGVVLLPFRCCEKKAA